MRSETRIVDVKSLCIILWEYTSDRWIACFLASASKLFVWIKIYIKICYAGLFCFKIKLNHANQSNKYEMHVSTLLTVCNPRLIILVGFRLAPRQSCCWCARQISLPWGRSKHLSPAFENGRDLPIKCLMWYWNGPRAVINSRQSLAVWWLLSVLFYAHWMPKTDVPSQ